MEQQNVQQNVQQNAQAQTDGKKPEMVNHPAHYRSRSGLEAIDVIEIRDMGFHLANSFKYLARLGRKAGNPDEQEVAKAVWYVERFADLIARGRATGLATSEVTWYSKKIAEDRGLTGGEDEAAFRSEVIEWAVRDINLALLDYGNAFDPGWYAAFKEKDLEKNPQGR